MSSCPVTEEMMHELNREIAVLHYLAYHVGAGRRDTRDVREKLAKTRRKCMEVCRELQTGLPKDPPQGQTMDLSEDDRKRLTSFCIALKLLAKELKILQRLSSTFPEKSVKSLFHYPTTFMFLDGSAARMMDGAGPSGASAESLQIYRERKEVMDLLVLLGPAAAAHDTDDKEVDAEDIFTEHEKKTFLSQTTCGIKNLLCCRRKATYL